MQTTIPIDGPRLCRQMAERGWSAIELARRAQVGPGCVRNGMNSGSLQAEKARRIGAALAAVPPDPTLVALMSPDERMSA